MKTVEEYDVKIHFSSILIDIERDQETFLICRNGKPIADLLPHVEQGKAAPQSDFQQALTDDPILRKLTPLIQAGVIVPHTKKRKHAVMPTIKVSGKPISQMIIEDRR